MGFYYPIPAGALVTCMNCHGLLVRHFDDQGGWRGCSIDGGAEIVGEHPVFLVSTNRRQKERRQGGDRRLVVTADGRPLVGPAEGDVRPVIAALPIASGLVPLVAGPRGAVYLAAPGAGLRGQTGQMAKVFQAISAGPQGKTMAELKKELKIKQKSLESVLYRLKLQGLVRAYNAVDVRG